MSKPGRLSGPATRRPGDPAARWTAPAPAGFLPDVLAALLREEPTPVALPSSETPATARALDVVPLGTRFTPPENVLTPSRVPARHADAWLGDVLRDVLTADLLGN